MFIVLLKKKDQFEKLAHRFILKNKLCSTKLRFSICYLSQARNLISRKDKFVF